ncbi:MAG: hypothetical protein ACUVWR_03345 [Anaerolineae bacterium]
MPDRQCAATSHRVLKLGWWLIPLILLCTWSFCQAVFIVSDLALFALSTGLGGDVAARLPLASMSARSLNSLTGTSITQTAAGVVQLLDYVGPWDWAAVVNSFVFLVFALLYWSWLVSWRVCQHKRTRS